MSSVRGFTLAIGALVVVVAAACDRPSAHTAAVSTTVGTSQPSTTGRSAVSSPPTRPLSTAVVAGRTDGASPCAPHNQGKFGADPTHPERSPIQAELRLAHSARWAVCGGDVTFQGDFLNLRSTDDGKTWRVTDIGFSFVPFHAGDRLSVSLVDAMIGRIRLVSLVAQSDGTCGTTDGGNTWHCTRKLT